jgi:carbamoyltransferase
MRFPHSLGLLYSAITAYLGFAVNNDEYKIMGMAPYGKPVHRDRLLRQVVQLNGDGSIRLDLDFFSFQFGRRMYDRRKFTDLFGVPPRTPGGEITQQHYDIAASLQRVTEEIVLAMAAYVRRETGSRNLCLAGGVSLNSVANGRLLREGPFDAVYVQPASGDAGGAVGAAYAAYHLYAGREDRHPLTDVYLGSSAGRQEITAFLDAEGMAYRILPDGEVERETARLLAAGKVVGWYQGRMEFGPRALGNRSILADPRRPDMKDLINRKIKFREGFRPFAPAVCEEDAGRYFGIDRPSPYMLFTVPVRSDAIPAVTHVDGSARIQTVSAAVNPLFHRLIREFGRISGVPVVLNTSLNIKGEPIARMPDDAVRCFTQSDMDALVMENVLIVK